MEHTVASVLFGDSNEKNGTKLDRLVKSPLSSGLLLNKTLRNITYTQKYINLLQIHLQR